MAAAGELKALRPSEGTARLVAVETVVIIIIVDVVVMAIHNNRIMDLGH